MSLNLAIDNTIANDASNNVQPSFVSCKSYLNKQITPDIIKDETFYSLSHTFNSYINRLLTIDLAINLIRDNIFDIDYITRNSHLDNLKAKEFEKWKES